MLSRHRNQNRFLLLRFYLLLAFGLISAAAVFDYVFVTYGAQSENPSTTWSAATFALIDERLLALEPTERAAVVTRLNVETGLSIVIYDRDQVADPPVPGITLELEGSAGTALFIRSSDTLDAIVQIEMPVADAGYSLVDAVPLLFYSTIFLLVGLWLRPLFRDLNHLSASAEAFSADYRRPLPRLDKVTSLTTLAQNLKAMASRIRQLIENQKGFTNALSHEIRTPLARMKFALAVDSENNKSAIELDIAEIDRLIDAMLDYARLDQAEIELQPFATPAAEWLAQFRGGLTGTAVTLAIEPVVGIDNLTMDPHLMALAVSNLLVNAERYAASEVRLSLTSEKVGGQTINTLSVDDDGDGVSAENQAAIFKAFARLDTSRNRETGGYGLGLAIVARIAELHAGGVRVGRSELGGAGFTLRWPESGKL